MGLPYSRFKVKLSKLVSRSRDLLAFSVDAQVTQWEQFSLINTFSPLKLFPHLLCRFKIGAISLVLITLNCPRQTRYLGIFRLLADSLSLFGSSRPSILCINLPPYFSVACFNDLSVKAQILKDGAYLFQLSLFSLKARK